MLRGYLLLELVLCNIMNKVKVCNSTPFHAGSKKSLKAFAINCKLGRVATRASLGKLPAVSRREEGRKVVKKLIFLFSSSTCLIFFWFYSGNSSLGEETKTLMVAAIKCCLSMVH